MDEQEEMPVTFKKRSKRTSSRKRVRTSTSDDGDDPASRRILSGSIEKPDMQKRRKAWTLEQYGISDRSTETKDSSSAAKDSATAEREDVGGLAVSSSKPKKAYGPMRAPSHLRTTTRMDYQADICKDYKETGYCGFGDACKFLHDRSDFKAGWKLDRDWAAEEKQRKENVLRGETLDKDTGDAGEKNENDDDGLPFACHICRKDFMNPIVTQCTHYFCEECAIKRIQKNATCAICNVKMDGTLNIATKLIAKLKARAAALEATRKLGDKGS